MTSMDDKWLKDDWRNNEINPKEYAWLMRVTRGAVLIGIGILIGMILFADPASRQSYVVNVFTRVLGLGATALIFDELNRKRSQDDLKRQLVDDAASTSNEIAKNAVHQIERKKWLRSKDGLLKGKNLFGANLVDAEFIEANLQETNFNVASLQSAKLWLANLRGANLHGANLRACAVSRRKSLWRVFDRGKS